MFSPPPRAQPRGLGGIRRLRGFASCVLSQRRVPPPVPGCPHLIAPEPRCRAADASPPPVSHPDTARARWKDTKRSPRMTAEGHHAGYERTRSFAPRQSPRWLRRNCEGGGGETPERMEFRPAAPDGGGTGAIFREGAASLAVAAPRGGGIAARVVRRSLRPAAL